MIPARVEVRAIRHRQDSPVLCKCGDLSGYIADIAVFYFGYDAEGKLINDWVGVQLLCADGADNFIDNIKRQLRELVDVSVPVVVFDLTGELDEGHVTDVTTNQCYVASEALYHLLGGKAAGYTPVCLTLTDDWRELLGTDARTHWYLEDPWGGYLDPTADQFRGKWFPPYHTGVRKGFLTKQPSAKAQRLIELAEGRI